MTKKISKEKEQKLKELKNKYFWEQKAIEIYCFIFIVVGVVVAFYLSSSIMLMISPEGIDCSSPSGCDTSVFFTGLFGLLSFALVCGVLALLGWLFYKLGKIWIENNKEKAEERAKKELGIKLDDGW